MKIGLFTDSYRPSISGVVISVDTLAKEFMKQGHEVVVVTNEHDHAEDEKNVIRFRSRTMMPRQNSGGCWDDPAPMRICNLVDRNQGNTAVSEVSFICEQ